MSTHYVGMPKVNTKVSWILIFELHKISLVDLDLVVATARLGMILRLALLLLLENELVFIILKLVVFTL